MYHYQIFAMVFACVIQDLLLSILVMFSILGVFIPFGASLKSILLPSIFMSIAYPVDILPLMKYSDPKYDTLSNFLKPCIFPVGIKRVDGFKVEQLDDCTVGSQLVGQPETDSKEGGIQQLLSLSANLAIAIEHVLADLTEGLV